MLMVRAPAKVNLVLEVLGRGQQYHDLCSIAQTIDLCDTLTFGPSPDIVFTCSAPELLAGNLVLRAAHLLQERGSISDGARIHLDKRIPWAAGLGGGSSDAAATLLALNRMWGTGLSHVQLVALGAHIGSDVPLFLQGGTVLLEGRGERVRPLPNLAGAHLVILAPHTPVPTRKTGLMYGRLRPEMFTRGQFVRAACFALERGGHIPEALMFNVFEKVADDVFDGLTNDRTLLERATSRSVHLAGSGPCLYAMVDSEEMSRKVASQLQELGRRAFAARAISADETHSDSP